MDVLTAFSATLSGNRDDGCLVKLLEYLGEERARGAGKLRKAVAKHRKAASKSLQACSSLIEKNFEHRTAKTETEWPVDAAAATIRLSRELTSWPRLSTRNLHPFRLKVKEMRYVLELSGKDNELTERLGEVKDQIGEWHDWTELDTIAKQVLSDCENCRVITQIEQTGKQKFATALGTAQQLRSKFFRPQGERQKHSRKKDTIREPVLKMAAGLAA
jgi:CHAD domain-containing protein